MIILSEYSKWLEVNGKSKTTIEQYSQQIRDFLSKIKLEDISEKTIITYLLELKNKYAPKTVNLYRTAIKSFLDYLKKDVPIPKQLKIEQKLPEFITLKYFESNVIPMIDLIFENPLKIKTIMYFMFFTGLRVGEISLLKRKYFNLKERTVKIFSPKTKKERIIFYNKKTRNLLDMYFGTTPESKNAFNTETSSIKGYFKRLKPYFKDINFHAHLLRHSFANHFLVNKGEISILKELLGHASIQSTMRYAGLNQEQLKKKYDEFIK